MFVANEETIAILPHSRKAMVSISKPEVFLCGVCMRLFESEQVLVLRPTVQKHARGELEALNWLLVIVLFLFLSFYVSIG